jgi:hypothetical protein
MPSGGLPFTQIRAAHPRRRARRRKIRR